MKVPFCQHAAVVILLTSVVYSAQTATHPNSPPAVKSPKASTPPVPPPDPGELVNGIYRNQFFGFTFKLPFGWVDRTDFMRQDSADASVDVSKSMVLLATFERPPEATGKSVNSAVVIAAENISSYPGLKDASQYLGPVAEIAKSKGFVASGDPYDFPIDGQKAIRQDFSKKLGELTMVQSSLVMLEHSYVVSITLIGGSEDEVDENVVNLKFERGKQGSPTKGR